MKMSIPIRMLILSALLVLAFIHVKAQSNYKKGYVITSEGDTLHGYINYQEWTRNPSAFSFKKNIGDIDIRPSDKYNTSLVSIPGFATYERAVASISMNEVIFQLYTPGVEPPVVTDTIFLQLISKGEKVKLYSYRDKLKPRFYIYENADAKLYELEYGITVQNNEVITSYGYRKQLSRLAAKYQVPDPALTRLIGTAPYVKANLRKIVNGINSVNEQSADELVQKSRKSRFFISAGVYHSRISYTGQNLVTANGLNGSAQSAYVEKRVTNSFLPKISAGFDMIFFPALQKSFLRMEVSSNAVTSRVLSTFQAGGGNDEILQNEFNLTGIYVGAAPQLMYSLYNRENLKFYAGTGVMFRLTFYPRKSIYMDTNKEGQGYSDHENKEYFQLRSTSAPLILTSGLVLNKKINISFTWLSRFELTENPVPIVYSVKGRDAIVSAYYLF